VYRSTRAVSRAMPWVLVATVSLVAAGPLPLQADPGPGDGGGGTQSLPNVLVIVTDDQRADGTLDVMPSTREWFGEGGTRFPFAYVTTPQCCPSRATLFSGRYAHNHGVHTNGEASNLNHAETVQAHLQAAGYRTSIYGKLFNTWKMTEGAPLFDDWAIFQAGYYGKPFNVNGTERVIEEYSTSYIARRAIRFLRQNEAADSRPWLMFVMPFAPHVPSKAEPAYRDAPVGDWEGNPAVLEADRSDKPPIVRDEPIGSLDSLQQYRRRQLRSLMSVDDLVGRIANELQRLGEEERTLAFFSSDNGLMWGEHGATGKGLPYTASIEVPLFVRWPGRVAAGRLDERIATMVDIAPTILQAAGIDTIPGQVDGRSLLESWVRDHMLIESWFVPWASLRTRSYQYTEWYDALGLVTFREYYDLANDPWQLTNLLGDANPANDPPPAVLASLSAQLATDRLCVGVDGPAGCP
jgi:arylsulfatase A-like enzyme